MSPSVSADTSSIDTIIHALYESISFIPDSQPDFTRLKSLFHSRGRLIPPSENEGKGIKVLDVDEFIRNSREAIIIGGMESKGFFERELHRQTESFGNIVHAFSTYESRFNPADKEPIQRGINSIQLVRDQGRWWVLTILWDAERPGNPISSKSPQNEG